MIGDKKPIRLKRRLLTLSVRGACYVEKISKIKIWKTLQLERSTSAIEQASKDRVRKTKDKDSVDTGSGRDGVTITMLYV